MQFKKKMVVLLSTALLATAVTGCTATTTTSTSDDVAVASFTQGSVNQSALNEQLLMKSGMQVMLDMVDKGILDEVVPVTDEMTATVDSNLENIKGYYKDDFESSLKINGFKDEADFKASLLLNEQRSQYTLSYISSELITEEAIQAYYDNYSPNVEASHILIKPEDESDAALALAKAKAIALIDRINAGEDFAELAKEFSADPGSGANGGALGSFGKGQMVAPFEEAAFALTVGQVTDAPVQSQFGFHIIKKTGGEEKPSLEEMKTDIEKALSTEALQADQNLTFKALVKLRADNGFEVSNPIIADQYKLFTEQLSAQ